MLNRPYPISSNAINWKTILIIGLFITLFLVVFQPFGLSTYNGPNKYGFIAGYGLVTIVILFLDSLFLKAYLKIKSGRANWTVRKQIIMQVLLLFTIGTGNYFYSAYHIHFYNPLVGFLVFQFFTTAVGLLPISIVTILNENIRNRVFLKEANVLNENVPVLHKLQNNNTITLTDEREKNPIEFQISDFLYAESSGNYLDVRYIKDGKVKSVLLRSTLMRAEVQLEPHTGVMRCHRAYLVNCEQIARVKGNAQGLRLQLNHSDDEIPVSRNYIKDLKSKLTV